MKEGIMVRHTTYAFVLVVLSISLLAGAAVANTLSDAYYQAFTDPRAFDGYLNDNVVLDSEYYDRLESCYQPTIDILDRMEAQERQQHQNCPNNAACTQIAKNIQSITNLRLNVKDLQSFLRSTKGDSQLKFLNSKIGRAALTVYNANRQYGVDPRRNPEFVKQIGILSAVSCQ
jgi:hypothetical protein